MIKKYGRGWFGESHRHYLAAKGFSSSVRSDPLKTSKFFQLADDVRERTRFGGEFSKQQIAGRAELGKLISRQAERAKALSLSQSLSDAERIEKARILGRARSPQKFYDLLALVESRQKSLQDVINERKQLTSLRNLRALELDRFISNRGILKSQNVADKQIDDAIARRKESIEALNADIATYDEVISSLASIQLQPPRIAKDRKPKVIRVEVERPSDYVGGAS